MKKILLVEDDPIMSRMYQKIFSYRGDEVRVAGDGPSGYATAKQWKPDLIVLDVMVPHMNGLELLQKLKTDQDTRGGTVVMLTNLGMQKEIDLAMGQGAAGYIIKSDHDPHDVFRMIEAIYKAANG